MNHFIYKGHSALDYAKEACDTLMRKFAPEDLPPKGRFHYHQGVFLSGMQKTYEICKEEKYYNYSKAWVDSIIDKDGNINRFDKTELDDLQPGILLYMLYHKTKDERYKKALYTLLPIIKDFPKTSEGGFWHKEVFEQQMWLDGLYMAGPICAQFAAEFGEEEYFDLTAHQAILMEKKTRDPKSGLWYHAWDGKKAEAWADQESGLGPEFWGRSIGWVPVAILDELDYFPEEHKDRAELVRMTTELLQSVVKYQDKESGLWYQVVDKGGCDGNWLESSCTCLFVAAICKAVRKGFLDKKYLEYAKLGYQGIIDRIKYNEAGIIIDNICVGTDVGDYEHYCKRPTSENDLHGVGAFLIMCAEVMNSLEV